MSITKKFVQGDVWYAEVHFSVDPTQSKIRPVVIVANDKAIDLDVLAAPITTGSPRSDYDVQLVHWKETGLPAKSVARTSKQHPIYNAKFKQRLGALHPDDLAIVLKKCRELY